MTQVKIIEDKHKKLESEINQFLSTICETGYKVNKIEVRPFSQYESYAVIEYENLIEV